MDCPWFSFGRLSSVSTDYLWGKTSGIQEIQGNQGAWEADLWRCDEDAERSNLRPVRASDVHKAVDSQSILSIPFDSYMLLLSHLTPSTEPLTKLLRDDFDACRSPNRLLGQAGVQPGFAYQQPLDENWDFSPVSHFFELNGPKSLRIDINQPKRLNHGKLARICHQDQKE